MAQCATVLSSRVAAYVISAAKSGAIPAQYVPSMAHTDNDLTSISSIDEMPEEIQSVIRDAFRDGSRWATMIILIPWCVLAVFSSLGLRKIRDTDREAQDKAAAETFDEEKVVTREEGLPTVEDR